MKCGTTHYVGCACHEASRDAEIHDLKATRTIFRRTLERIRDWCRYQGEWRDLKPEGIAALIETAKLLSEAERKAAGKPDLVDSERAANEILTNENEALAKELSRLRARIGEWADRLELWSDRHADVWDCPIVGDMREEAEK